MYGEIDKQRRRRNGKALERNQAKRAAAHRERTGASLLESATTERERKQLMRNTMDAALQGQPRAVEAMMSRIAPPLRPQAPAVTFDLDTSDAPAAARSILSAVAGGVLNSEQGRDLLMGLNQVSQIDTLANLQQEVATLREQIQDREQLKGAPVLTVLPGEAKTDTWGW